MGSAYAPSRCIFSQTQGPPSRRGASNHGRSKQRFAAINQGAGGVLHRQRSDRPAHPDHATGMGGAMVTFEPGARTAWHTHPLGQMLIVTAGCGLVQSWGGPIVKIRPGDVVWCPPGEKHWHGATSKTGMTHIAILESLDGKNVDWMEHVTDREYAAGERAEQ